MIGLSISFCIADIIRGKVNLEDVEKIVAGTKCETPEHWDGVIEQYKEYYWRDDPDMAEAVLRQMLAEGKIEQPRTKGIPIHSIASGHWAQI